MTKLSILMILHEKVHPRTFPFLFVKYITGWRILWHSIYNWWITKHMYSFKPSANHIDFPHNFSSKLIQMCAKRFISLSFSWSCAKMKKLQQLSCIFWDPDIKLFKNLLLCKNSCKKLFFFSLYKNCSGTTHMFFH